MSASESDYLPSEDDEEEEQHVADPMTGVGAMTEDYLTEDTSGKHLLTFSQFHGIPSPAVDSTHTHTLVIDSQEMKRAVVHSLRVG